MMMVQDGPYLNAPEKPLRIMGDSMRAQRGRDLVQDLLTEKELEVSGHPGNRNWQVMIGKTGIKNNQKSSSFVLECYLIVMKTKIKVNGLCLPYASG